MPSFGTVVVKAAVSTACALLLFGTAFARAEDRSTKSFDISPRSMAAALREFARQSGEELLFAPQIAAEKVSDGIRGDYAPLEALREILGDTGLTFSITPSGAILVQLEGKALPTAAAGANPQEISEAGAGKARQERYRLAWAQDAAAGSGGAQTTSAPVDEAVTLDEVTVLGTRSKFRVQSSAAATKIDMPLKDTPQAMTILSDELLRAASISTTADLGDYAPGLQEAGRGDGTQVVLTSRGFDVVRDRGYKINGLAADSEIDIDYAAVERVEVVRGPASVLYGEVDYGATINRVLKRPTRDFQAITSLELGSFDLRRVELDVGGPLGGSERVGGRVVVAYQDSDDRVDFVHLRSKVVAPTIAWQLNDTGSLAVHGYYQKSDGRHSDGFAVLPDGTLPDVPRGAFLGADQNSVDTENRFLNVSYDQRFGAGWKLGARAALSQIKLDNFTTFVSNGIFAVDDGNGGQIDAVQFDGRAPLMAFPELKDKKDLSFDVTLSKSFEMWGREHTLALSGDYRRNEAIDKGSDFLGIGFVNLFEGQPLVVDPALVASMVRPEFRYEEDLDLSGVSLLALIKPTERLHILAGLRNTRSESVTLYQGVSAESNLSDTLGRFGFVYRLSDDWSAYASWSEGIIFNAHYYDADFRPVDPEHGEQIELGAKADLFGGRASFAASVFRLERTDSLAYLSSNTEPPFNDIYGNVGKQNHQGVEIELLGEVVPGLNVLASYQYLDIEVLDSPNPAAIGNRPPNAPRNSASAFLTYAFPQAALNKLTIGGGVVYRSKREADDSGTLSLPAFTRLDLRASYDFSERLVGELIGKNLTNEKIIGSTYTSANLGLIYLDPRSYGLRMSYRF